MNKPFVTVQKLFDRFGGDFININDVDVNTRIYDPSLSRLGFELNQIFFYHEISSVVVWGNMESKMLDSLPELEQKKRLAEILKTRPPLIILSSNFRYLDLLTTLNESFNTKVPIIKTQASTVSINSILGPWLARKLANWKTIHGTLISIFGEGVLLIGQPGSGKSEVALELIKNNHLFVGDDSIEITVIGNDLVGRPNPLISGFIEVRGLGILNVKRMYGIQKILNWTNINLVIELMSNKEMEDKDISEERLGRILQRKKILDLSVPHYVIPVTNGRKIGDIVESAVIDFKLNEYEKYNAGTDLNQNIVRHMAWSEEE